MASATPPQALSPDTEKVIASVGAKIGAKQQVRQVSQVDQPNILGAILLGLAASVISGLILYGFVVSTQWMIGWLAVGVGYLVSYGVVMGSGWHRGLKLQLLSMGLILLTMMVSEYCIVYHFAEIVAIKRGQDISFIQPPDIFFFFIGIGIKASPITILFWLIALYEGFKIPSESADD